MQNHIESFESAFDITSYEKSHNVPRAFRGNISPSGVLHMMSGKGRHT
jgi:hypothetical protein